MLGLLQGFKFLIFLMEGIGDVFMDLKTGLFSAILGVSMLASSAFGVDYSTMSIEELSKMRALCRMPRLRKKRISEFSETALAFPHGRDGEGNTN
jgi:hypothetical protein